VRSSGPAADRRRRRGRVLPRTPSLLTAAILATATCGGEAPEAGSRAPASFETEDTVLSDLASIPVEAVRGRTGPGGDTVFVALRTAEGASHLHRRIGRERFDLARRVRSPALTQYPCSSCHAGQDVVPGGARDEEVVHQNVRPVHPRETGADCGTCHGAEDVSRLRLEAGGTTSLNHAYQLCAQCHAATVDSWANGAHGKRLIGWRGRRVVMNCTDCHDPHAPAAEPRIPYPGPEIPGEGVVRP